MAFTSAQLRTYIQTNALNLADAQGRTLPQLFAAAQDQAVADLLNDQSKGGANVTRNDIAPGDVFKAIVPADFTALTVAQLLALIFFFTSNSVVDATDSNTVTLFRGVFAGKTNTLSALTAMAQRPGSPAEVQWGTGTFVTAGDVAGARP